MSLVCAKLQHSNLLQWKEYILATSLANTVQQPSLAEGERIARNVCAILLANTILNMLNY